MLLVIACAFIAAFALSLVLTRPVIRLAETIGAIDRPNERKIHQTPVPRLGGVAVAGSVLLTMGALFVIVPDVFAGTWLTTVKGPVLLAATALVIFTGIRDDLKPMGPGRKFLLQAVAATACYAVGFRISTVTDLFGPGGEWTLGALDYPVTILWITGVMNAVNMIDGLDGLASGVGVIATVTMASILLPGPDAVTGLVALVIAGALLGFLKFNFNPARIFLGDSGSLFLGFALAVLSVQGSTKVSTVWALIVPVVSLGLPIMDMLLSMIRRLLAPLVPSMRSAGRPGVRLGSIFLPDRSHIHHRLISLGFSHRRAVIVLYVVSCAFGAVAFLITISNGVGSSLILVAVSIATIAGIRQLRYREMAILRNGVLLPIFDLPFFRHALFQPFLDLVFSVTAFAAAFVFSSGLVMTPEVERGLLIVLPVVAGIQIAVFAATGLYRGVIRHVELPDLLGIVRTTAIAAAIPAAALLLIAPAGLPIDAGLFLLDFYFLVTLVAGSRLSFAVLEYLFHRNGEGGKRVVIYGAGTEGIISLRRMLSDRQARYTPVGFLDDDPRLEGKLLNGYRVLGSHWKLPGLLSKHKIEEVLICATSIRPAVMERLLRIASVHGVAVTRSRHRLETIKRAVPARWMPRGLRPTARGPAAGAPAAPGAPAAAVSPAAPWATSIPTSITTASPSSPSSYRGMP